MSAKNHLPERLRVAHLSATRDNAFEILPDAQRRAGLADDLGLIALPEMSFAGTVRPAGADDWALSGQLHARVVQPCVITLEPVETELSETVSLVFSPNIAEPEGEEVEMGDDSIEPLGQSIDIGALAFEALSLALPTNPRAPGADLPESLTPEAEGSEDTRKPFAGLGDLLKRKT